MAHCPRCGKVNPDDFGYCVYCGAQLREVSELEQEAILAWEEDVLDPEEREKPASEYLSPEELPPVGSVGFGEAIAGFFKKYAQFKGRATRAEFWLVYLFMAIVRFAFVFLFIGVFAVSSALLEAQTVEFVVFLFMTVYGIWEIMALIPWLALYWRRLHDTGKSGSYFFMILIPAVGEIFLIVELCLASDGDNQYGPRRTAAVLAAEKEAGEE